MLIGFLAVCVAETKLDQLFITPNRQGRGVGRALFEVAKAQMPGGFWLSTQPANRRAREFYERRGMSVDQKRGGADRDRVFYLWPASSPSD